jgi:chromosome partitioning protein
MSLTIAVIGQAGEPGATTTAVNLAAAFASTGKRVLIVDSTSGAAMGAAVGVIPQDTRSVGAALLRQMDGETPRVEEMVHRHDQVFPVGRLAGTLDAFLATAGTAHEADLHVGALGYPGTAVLRTVLDQVQKEYDLVVIDTPPPMRALSAVGLAAADLVVAVSELSRAALPGAVMLKAHVDAMGTRTQGQSSPQFLGTVLNKVPPAFHGTPRSDADECHFGKHQLMNFGTRIYRDALISGARELGAPVCTSHPEAQASSDYRSLAAEVVGRTHCAVA